VVLVARGFEAGQLGQVYAPVMILSFLGMAPMMMFSERKNAHLFYLRMAAAFIVGALIFIGYINNGGMTAIALFMFFVGFNFIEATLPSLLSRKADISVRGTSMGVFSTSQFLGAAVGGIAGGLLFESASITGIVILGIAMQLAWAVLLLVVKPLKKPVLEASQ
jgi:predicted MFS family arabinose efflux permease